MPRRIGRDSKLSCSSSVVNRPSPIRRPSASHVSIPMVSGGQSPAPLGIPPQFHGRRTAHAGISQFIVRIDVDEQAAESVVDFDAASRVKEGLRAHLRCRGRGRIPNAPEAHNRTHSEPTPAVWTARAVVAEHARRGGASRSAPAFAPSVGPGVLGVEPDALPPRRRDREAGLGVGVGDRLERDQAEAARRRDPGELRRLHRSGVASAGDRVGGFVGRLPTAAVAVVGAGPYLGAAVGIDPELDRFPIVGVIVGAPRSAESSRIAPRRMVEPSPVALPG